MCVFTCCYCVIIVVKTDTNIYKKLFNATVLKTNFRDGDEYHQWLNDSFSQHFPLFYSIGHTNAIAKIATNE